MRRSFARSGFGVRAGGCPAGQCGDRSGAGRLMAEDRLAAATDALCAVLRGEAVDWPPAGDADFYRALTEQAAYHGVDALACHLLKNTPAWDALPAAAREALLLRVRQYGAIELVRRHDLETLLGALQRAGVGVLLLKGAALAYTLYPEPHLRARVDTDLFIDTADIGPIKRVFAQRGYDLVGRTYKSHQFNSLRRDLGHGSINYDVHWRASNRALYARVIGFEEALRESLALPGLPWARALPPPLALLQACMHRAANPEHDPNRLVWLYDLHLLASHMDAAQWQSFAQRAVAENLQAICRDALEAARARFATALPQAAQAVLASPPRTEGPLQRRLLSSPLGLVLDDLRELPDLRARAALLREYLAPPGAYLLARYGKSGRAWLPWLYLRYLGTGLLARLTLR
ncbi:MAG: nucleotidyltransferase family protein [Xanthomonadales bacterium]|nr:nucleotidyltransferase family protein [Xanthomonadales bacterium]